MKKLLSAILLILCINSFLHAQFKEGYIINNDNDTSYGYIDFEGSIKNCDHCTFRSNLDSISQVCYPRDIQAFRFLNGKYFISREIPIYETHKKVFLEWLIKGKASILTYSGPGMQSKYYILSENDSLIELLNTAEIREINTSQFYSSSHEINKKEYIGMLHYYFRDCPEISSDINTTGFDSKSFIKIAKKYHEKTCTTEECIVFEDKNRRLKSEIGVNAGCFYSNFRIKNGRPENVDYTLSPAFGISIRLTNLPLLSPKFSIRSQFSYSNIEYTYYSDEIYFFTDTKLLTFNIIRIPLQMSYKFSYSRFSPYISAGITANLRYGYTVLNQINLNYLTTFYNYDGGITFMQLGINTGFGLEYKIKPRLALDIGFDYEYGYRFFGTWVQDFSYSNNYILQMILLYRLN